MLIITVISLETDPFFGKILNIITNEDYLKGKWFNFGYELGLTIGQLDNIETKYQNPLQCTRKVVLQLRVKKRSALWEPL